MTIISQPLNNDYLEFNFGDATQGAYGELLKTGADLLGKDITSIGFYVGKIGSPTGTLYIGVKNAGANTFVQYGTLVIGDLTSTLTLHEKTGSHTMVANDVPCAYQGADYAANGGKVKIAYQTGGSVYDGALALACRVDDNGNISNEYTNTDMAFRFIYSIATGTRLPPPPIILSGF